MEPDTKEETAHDQARKLIETCQAIVRQVQEDDDLGGLLSRKTIMLADRLRKDLQPFTDGDESR